MAKQVHGEPVDRPGRQRRLGVWRRAALGCVSVSRRTPLRRRPAARPAQHGGREARPEKEHGRGQKDVESSERLAKEALLAGDVGLDAVRRALERMEVPLRAHRHNVIPEGQSAVRGMLFGLFCYGGRTGVSKATHGHPWLVRLLVAALRAQEPAFPFSSIQLNHNYAARPHVDYHNLGCSCIVGFGGYTGGELWVHDEETGTEPHELGEDISARYRAGQCFRGRLEDVNGRWLHFDGGALHFTQPFEGNRYSLVYFCSDQLTKTPAAVRRQLTSAGFDLDWHHLEGLEGVLSRQLTERREQSARLAREAALQRSVEVALERGRCTARIWADGWGERCCAACLPKKDLCGQHAAGNRWRTHGRFGGELPPAKREEMARTQRRWLKQGRRPPSEPWTQLVPLAEVPKEVQ